jgi:hypothetical protein
MYGIQINPGQSMQLPTQNDTDEDGDIPVGAGDEGIDTNPEDRTRIPGVGGANKNVEKNPEELSEDFHDLMRNLFADEGTDEAKYRERELSRAADKIMDDFLEGRLTQTQYQEKLTRLLAASNIRMKR